MVEVTERPRRKRLSWESRCEIVARIEPPYRAVASRQDGDLWGVGAYRIDGDFWEVEVSPL